jgi:TolB-like protein
MAAERAPGGGAAPMTPERWREVTRVVDAALELPPEARAAWVEQACSGDAELRGEVERLLSACERAEGFLDEPAQAYAAPLLAELAALDAPGPDGVPAPLADALAGRYTLERELGRGGMATVYLARDERHARSVAVKVLHRDLGRELGGGRFLREIAIASALAHPHVVPLYDSGEADGLLYYVMPYVPGQSLRRRLEREGPLALSDAVAVARDVAEALDYAHAHGIVHRDVKPDNILLDEGRALVADFGVARAVEAAGGERLTRSGLVIGTPGYMSPEQATGARRIDGRSDVYALACVVYEMLAGEPPFTGATPRAVLAKHAQAPVPPLRVVRPTIPDGVQQVLETALAKVPGDRFASAGELARALQAAAAGSTPRRPRRARRVLLAGAAVAAAGAALLLLPPGRPRASGETNTPAPAAPDPRRLAVLYLDDLSPGSTLGHVASGLTEDLIDELGAVRALHVVSPNGVRPYRGRAVPVDSVSRALGVGTLVAGSVASSGGRLRVTVRLIDARGRQLQSRTLERPWTELFALQDTLTAEVALLLRARLGEEVRLREQRAGTTSVRAWERVQQGDELAVQGRTLVRGGDPRAATELLLRADSLYAAAERLDRAWTVPAVGRGWAAYALAFVSPGPHAPADSAAAGRPPSPAWLLRALAHGEGALRRRAGEPEALALRGEMRYRLVAFGAFPGADSLVRLAEGDLRTAVNARPDFARAWHTLGEMYYRDGRFAEAAAAARNALEGDAFLTEVRAVVWLLYTAALHGERFAEARSWCGAGLRRYPGDPRFAECELSLLAATARERGDGTAAWRLVEGIERQDSLGMLSGTWVHRRMMVAAVLVRGGMPDSARAVLRRALAEQPRRSPGAEVRLVEAHIRVLLGEHDAALRLLASLIKDAPHYRGFVARSPWFRPLHADPRFRALAAGVPSPAPLPTGS